MKNNLPIIDTHFHIWDASELTLPTLDLFPGILNPKYSLQDYLYAIANYNIVKSCYEEVDTLKEQQRKEADMIIQLCHDDSNQIVGATIGADLSSKIFKEYIEYYAKEKCVKAIRHNFFATDPALTKQTIFIENVSLHGELNIMCDLVMAAEKISHGVELVANCPNTIFVIDHCGVCPIKADKNIKTIWQQGIGQYAKHKNTICKISECCFTAADYQWQVSDVIDIIQHCVNDFGEDRIVYGTNWPICEMTGSIGRWITAIKTSLQAYPESFFKKLFYDNAVRYYKL